MMAQISWPAGGSGIVQVAGTYPCSIIVGLSIRLLPPGPKAPGILRQEKPVRDGVGHLDAREKLLQLTRHNIGRTLGVVINGQLQSTSVIDAPIETGVVTVTGHMLEHGAKRFCNLLARQGA